MRTFIMNLGILIILVGVLALGMHDYKDTISNFLLALAFLLMISGLVSLIYTNKHYNNG
ncbi:MAG: hypothetical protein JXR39_04255 [Marinilabiliaceae bacterium]|nr:hypothetical protein [Marinilabiliaceae bacterium]